MADCSNCKWHNETGNGEHCKNCVNNAENNFEPMTIADRIRNMSDEELASFIRETVVTDGRNLFDCKKYYDTDDCNNTQCEECVVYLKWLKSPVEEE